MSTSSHPTPSDVPDGPGDLTPHRLTEIRQRADAATPGPWTVQYEDCDCPIDGCSHGQIATGFGPFTSIEAVGPHTRSAEFAAHARVDVDDLLADNERLQRTLRAACDHIAVLDGAIAAQTARANAAEASRDAVLVEARDATVEWLGRKAAEERSRGARYVSRADLIAKLASKVARGAIRLFHDAAAGGEGR